MSIERLTYEERVRLGLGPDPASAVEEIPLPAESAQGKGELLALAALALQISNGQVQTSAIASSAARHSGVELEWVADQRAVVARTVAGRLPRVRTTQGAVGETLPDEAAVVFFATPDAPFAIHDGDRPLTLRIHNGRMELREEAESVLEVERLASLRAPDELLQLAMDAWLKSQVAACLSSSSSWSQVLGAALIARLIQAETTSGTVDERRAAPRRWARAWNPAEARTAEDLAIATAAQCLGGLDACDRDEAEESASVEPILENSCILRDDVEAVRSLLVERDQHRRLDDLLRIVDRAGSNVVLSFPALRSPPERLRRAAAADPDTWWASVVEEDG